MSASTTYQKARISLAMLGLNGLPLDEYLSELPPLPDTPKNAKRIDDIPEGMVPTKVSHYSSPTVLSLQEAGEGLNIGDGIPRARSLLASMPVVSADDFADESDTFEESDGAFRRKAQLSEQSTLQPPLASSTSVEALSSPGHSQAAAPRLSASFRLPAMGDLSLIGDDCSLFGGAASSIGDDSLDLELSQLRLRGAKMDGPSNGTLALIERADLLRPPNNHLNQSSLLPSSPARHAHLLASTNGLHRVQPPWSGKESTMSTTSDHSEDTITGSEPSPLARHLPKNEEQPLPRSNSLRGFPTSQQTKSKRTFPASSSGNSLAAVGEEREQDFVLDKSTLFPHSPQKAAHLLSDNEMISRETLGEETSYRLAAPPVLSMRQTGPAGNDADKTMDVRDLMAKVGKPKRVSGTEESFVDLLHEDDDSMAKMDMTMADETIILPARLRPRQENDHSPAKRELPVVGNLPTQSNKRDLMDKPSTISRSKSMSRVAEIIQRVKADKLASATAAATRPNSPPKTVSIGRTYKSSTTAVTPAAPRSRLASAPHTTGPRPILPSAGAVPMSSSASQKVIELPASRPTHVRSASTHSQLPSSQSSSSLSRRVVVAKTPVTSRHGTTRLAVRELPGLTARVSRESLAPATRTEIKTRTGSMSSVVSTAASVAKASVSRSETTAAARTLPRSSTRGGLSSSPALTHGVSRSSMATSAVPTGLPQPGNGPTARSALTTATPSATVSRARGSRAFGSDAASATNKPTRSTTSTLPIAPKPLPKLSTGTAAITARSAISSLDRAKSRALSTPATTVTRTLPSSRTGIVPAKKCPRPPSAIISEEAPKPRMGSTVPRPSTARVAAVGGGKMSAPPATDTSRSSLASLKSRLDTLQARQQTRGTVRRAA